MFACTQVAGARRDLLAHAGAEYLVIGILEHEPHFARQGGDRRIGHRPSRNHHLSARGAQQSVEVLGQRGLAGPVLADEGDVAPTGKLEVDAPQGGRRVSPGRRRVAVAKPPRLERGIVHDGEGPGFLSPREAARSRPRERAASSRRVKRWAVPCRRFSLSATSVTCGTRNPRRSSLSTRANTSRGVADPLHTPLREYRHPVGELRNALRILLHHDDGHAPLPAKVSDHREDLLLSAGVEACGRLVEHQDLRSHREHGRNRHPLLLPARQLEGRTLEESLDADHARRPVDALHDLLGRHSLVLQSEGDLRLHVHVEELSFRVLKHDPHPPRQAGDRFGLGVEAIDPDLTSDEAAGRLRDDAHERETEGGLARPGRSHDREELSALDVEIDALEHPLRCGARLQRGVGESEAPHADDGAHVLARTELLWPALLRRQVRTRGPWRPGAARPVSVQAPVSPRTRR